MRLEELDGLGFAIFEDFEILLMEPGNSDTLLVSHNDVEQHVANIDLQRVAGRLRCRQFVQRRTEAKTVVTMARRATA